MNVVLIFSVLILIAIAIWQVTKIFELSQVKKVSTQVADTMITIGMGNLCLPS